MAAVVTLPAVLDIRAADPLKADLLAVRGQALTLDASAVERLGGLCLQVLLSARKTWATDGHDLTVAPASDAFSEQWAAFGAPAFAPAFASDPVGDLA